MVRNDHPGNVTRGGVCAYFRESLPVRCISNPYLNECLIFEISVDNKKGYVVSFYRSLSQTSDEFEAFLANLEKLIFDVSSGYSDFVLLIGDINAKSRNWSNHDITLTSFSMKQMITEPTRILENTSSCIDLNQVNIILDSGVHSSLHPKCHHQIIFKAL